MSTVPLTLETVSSAKVRGIETHICHSFKGVKALRNAAAYNENTAGKITIARVSTFLRAAVLMDDVP